ncbi:MAG: PKD domain-containing protein [Saprospiraceae bacterium]|nr:PKD domain-containing protein [Saprospiraceae bacterium]
MKVLPSLKYIYCSILVLFSFTITAQTTVSFSATDTAVCVPALIQFSDNTSSSNSIVSWEWTRDGNFVSNLQDPALLFNTPGTYDICLSVTDNLGNITTQCETAYITIFALPNADFSVDVTEGCAPLDVNFTDLSTLGDAPITDWLWDFGDGVLDSTQQNPFHSYTTLGNFDVTLVITDSNTCSSSILVSDLITTYDVPTAIITNDLTVPVCGLPGTITFNGFGQSATPPLTYTWDFGDNTTAIGQTSTHLYTSPGCYTPTLTVASGNCATTVVADTCLVVVPAPVADFTMDAPTACELPHVVNFTNNSSNANSYTWSFGNGGSSTAISPSHTYTAYDSEGDNPDGVFPIVLAVTNSEGCVDTLRDTVLISNLEANINLVSINNCIPSGTTTFSDNSTNVSNAFQSVTWNWDFGNTLGATTENTSTTYPDSGTYVTQLIVTDNIGCVDSVSLSNSYGILPVIDSFVMTPDTLCRSDKISLQAWGSSYIDSWSWSFSDGTGTNGASTTHEFIDTGLITGTVIASFNGCETMLNLNPTYVLPPIAQFAPNIDCGSLTVDFLNTSIGADTWFWDFGDTTVTTDTNSIDFNPTYTYPDTGIYEVVLSVWNATTNCFDDTTVVVNLRPLIADFEIQDTICAPDTIQPINTSINGAFWSWGTSFSGNYVLNSADAEPQIVFQTEGLDTIRLLIGASNGCIDTFKQVVYVSRMQAQISAAPPFGCAPLNTTLTDATLSTISPVIAWTWDMGETASSINRTYTNPGVYTASLIVQNDFGCVDTASIQLNADFVDASLNAQRDVCIGNSVLIFSSSTSSAPLDLSWDFGDGNSSTDNPFVFHTYASAGLYTVCLAASTLSGCSDTVCLTDWIEVHDPSALFTQDTTFTTCPPLEVNFTDLSPSGTQWSWDFGDGSTSNLENPSHIYSDAGSYDVTLTVSAIPGCTDTRIYPDLIQISGPSGSIYAPSERDCAPVELELVGTGQNTISYTWLYGNGDFDVISSTDTTDTISYSYTLPGTYIPELVLDDGLGCTISFQGDTIVVLGVPEVSFIADSLICETDSILFEAVNAANYTYEWSFEGAIPNTANIPNPQVYYPDTGTWDVELIVSEGLCSDTLNLSNWVEVGEQPNAGFEALWVDTCGAAVNIFTDTSSSGSGVINQWIWNGVVGTATDTVAYPVNDSFIVELIVSNDYGCTDTANLEIYTRPIPTVSIDPISLDCNEDSVQLLGNSSTGNYTWETGANLSDSTIMNPWLYTDSVVTVFLSTETVYGCRAIDSTVLVLQAPIALNLEGDTICIGETGNLTASSNPDYTYLWQSTVALSDNAIPNPSTNPSQTTWYSLLVTDTTGCEIRDSVQVIVNDLPSFTMQGDSICTGDTGNLNVSSNPNYTYLWQSTVALSDNAIPNPSTSPTQDTWYSLLVTDTTGCENTDSVRVIVNDLPSFTMQGDSICTGEIGNLNVSSNPNYTYLWQSTVAVSNNTIPNPTSSPVQNTWYSLLVTDTTGCENTDSVQVIVNDLPSFTMQGDSICEGETGNLTASSNPNYTYLWQSTVAVSNNTIPNPSTSPMQDTWYSLLVTDTTGCENTDSVQVIVSPAPSFALEGDSICEGETGNLTASSNPDYTYLWQSTVAVSDNTIPNPNSSPVQSTWYSLLVTDTLGCENSDSVQIVVNTLPNFSIEGDSICEGETAFLTASSNPDYTYFWQSTVAVSDNTIPDPSTNPIQDTWYTLLVTDVTGCERMDSTFVLVSTLPNAAITASVDTLCEGDSVLLSATGGANYTWLPNNSVSDVNQATTWAYPDSSQQYIVEVDENGCIARDTVWLEIRPRDVLLGNDVVICIGDTVQLGVSGASANTELIWSPITGLGTNVGDSVWVNVNSTTTYYVIGYSDYCITDTLELVVEVGQDPVITLSSNYEEVESGTTLNFNSEPSDLDYQWQANGILDCTNCVSAAYTATENDVIYVTAVDLNGCQTQDSIVIQVVENLECTTDLVFVPNTFTPNGDGMNDLLYARSGSITELNAFRIYNRWGNLIFETKDMNQAWDGTYRGKKLSTDVFAYTLEFRCPQTGDLLIKQGNISLIR